MILYDIQAYSSGAEIFLCTANFKFSHQHCQNFTLDNFPPPISSTPNVFLH